MATIPGWQSGKDPVGFTYRGYSAPNRLGQPVGVAYGAGAQTITLPNDYENTPYGCYLLTAGGAFWVAFTNGTGAAAIAGTNCFLFPTGTSLLVVPPSGATAISVFPDASNTNGGFCVTGLY